MPTLHMKPVTAYMVLVEFSTNGLAYAVQIAIGNGWQPYGNLTTAVRDGNIEYIQPMVRRDAQ